MRYFPYSQSNKYMYIFVMFMRWIKRFWYVPLLNAHAHLHGAAVSNTHQRILVTSKTISRPHYLFLVVLHSFLRAAVFFSLLLFFLLWLLLLALVSVSSSFPMFRFRSLSRFVFLLKFSCYFTVIYFLRFIHSPVRLVSPHCKAACLRLFRFFDSLQPPRIHVNE